MPKLVTKAYENWPEVAGQFCIGERNDSGEKLLQFSTINNLAIMNWLYHRVQQKHKSNVNNCRVYNYANIGSYRRGR